MGLPVLNTEAAEFMGRCSLLQGGSRPQAAIKFAYPAFDEHSDEHSEKYDPETSVEESLDDNSVLEGRSQQGHMIQGSNCASSAFGKSKCLG